MSETQNTSSIYDAFMAGQPQEEVIETVEVPVVPTTPEEVPVTPVVPAEEPIVPVTPHEPVIPIDTANEPVTPVVPAEPAKPWEPEFKSEKDRYVYDQIVNGNEEELFKTLNEKYGFKSMSDENKLMAYLSVQNPGLDEQDIAFMAAHEFGIGATDVDEEDLTDDQRVALRQQSILRKKTLNEANNYFTEKANKTELPSLPSVTETDAEYKAYKEAQVKQVEEQQIFEQNKKAIFADIDSTAPSITEVAQEVKVKIDEVELDYNINFKLDQNKQQQLAQYAKEYTPTQAEYQAYTDQSGKFDMKGYMQSLTDRLFHKEIVKAAIKQAIAQDRENFVEGTLKNSTLRNNDVSRETVTELNEYDAYWGKR